MVLISHIFGTSKYMLNTTDMIMPIMPVVSTSLSPFFFAVT